MAGVFKGVISAVAKAHNNIVKKRFGEFGLKYQDAYASTPIVDVAVSRLPSHVKEASYRRQLRAGDISQRRKYLKPEQQNVDVLDDFLTQHIKNAEFEAYEKRVLNHW